MGQKTEFKVNIGDIVTSYNRNLLIIDREYRTKEQKDGDKIYTGYRKYYKYRCLNCGNEDWISEYLLCGVKYHSGCNVCSEGSKKILRGYNDIATTASWMMDYILDEEFCYTHAKSSLEKTKMKCPLCGNIKSYSPSALSSNKDLPCKCKDTVHVGDRFDKLTVIKDSGERRVKTIKWECKCDCGNTILATTSDLINGSKTSCGCARKKKVHMKNRVLEKPKFRFEIGDTITTNNRDLTIIDMEYRPTTATISYFVKTNGKEEKCDCVRNLKYYKYKCNKCGNEGWIRENSLCGESRLSGCNKCWGLKIGENDVATAKPWMVKYFANKDETKTTSFSSTKKVKMICPDCGKVYMKSPSTLSKHNSFHCTCNDAISYPNKFLYAFLDNCNIDFTPEKNFTWSDKKRYDAYIKLNNEKIIIEMQGAQHYGEAPGFFRSYEEEAENDRYKKDMAIKNGITHYYQIDAHVSDCNLIENSMIESGLLDVLKVNPHDVDWGACDIRATKNIDKLICEYHDANPEAIMPEICKIFHVGYSKVRSAVKKGLKYNWCKEPVEYFKKDEKYKNISMPIYCVTNDTYYHNVRVANDILKIYKNEQSIRSAIASGRSCKGYEFEPITITNFNETKSKFPEKCFGDFFNIKENTA